MRFADNRRSSAPVINVTSLIDVMFLLVIFVLVTAKYDTEGGIAVDLPKGAAKEAPGALDVVDLTVMHDGTLFLDRERVNEAEFGVRLASLREKVKDPVLVIRTDRDAPAGTIIRVTEIAKGLGQQKLNFKTKE